MLPARLYPGYVSIYGAPSSNGLVIEKNGYQFGTVDQMLGGGTGTLTVGQSIMFHLDNGIPITYNNSPYFLVQEHNIILIEEAPP